MGEATTVEICYIQTGAGLIQSIPHAQTVPLINSVGWSNRRLGVNYELVRPLQAALPFFAPGPRATGVDPS